MYITSETCRVKKVNKITLNNLHQAGPSKPINKICCLQYKVLLDYILILLIISGTRWEVIHQKNYSCYGNQNFANVATKILPQIFTGARKGIYTNKILLATL